MTNIRELDTNSISDLKGFLNDDVDFREYCKRFSKEHKMYVIDEVLSQAIVRSYAECRKEQYIADHP